MKRVLVTGATGFVGSHIPVPLCARGFEVHTIGRTTPGHANVVHHRADLLDPHRTCEVVHAIRATHLVRLSWYAEPGQFRCARQNLDWVSASLQLARHFVEAGGRRIVAAGTCAEYSWGPNCLVEGESVCNPATLYGVSKDALRRLLQTFGDVAQLSVSWGRVFFLYGPGEKTGRLVSDAIASLLAGERFETSHGRQRRDFMHVEDVASAFASLADSDVRGAVNVGSGAATPVRTILEQIARETGRSDLIAFGARHLSTAEPDTIAASTKRLREVVGFRPDYDLARGVAQTVAWWRAASAPSQPTAPLGLLKLGGQLTVGRLSRFLRKLSGTLCGDLRTERSSRAATFAYRGEMQLRVERTASTKPSQAYGATLDHERR